MLRRIWRRTKCAVKAPIDKDVNGLEELSDSRLKCLGMLSSARPKLVLNRLQLTGKGTKLCRNHLTHLTNPACLHWIQRYTTTWKSCYYVEQRIFGSPLPDGLSKLFLSKRFTLAQQLAMITMVNVSPLNQILDIYSITPILQILNTTLSRSSYQISRNTGKLIYLIRRCCFINVYFFFSVNVNVFGHV